jgi:hypothetical protein
MTQLQWNSLIHAASGRRDAIPEYTDTTTTTLSSSILLSRGGRSDEKKRGLISSLSRIKIPGTRRWRNRKKPISEARLREKLIQRAEGGDWSGVRKLISNYEFADVIPEGFPLCTKSIPPEEGQEPHLNSDRRPSYGSRSGDRLSFTGKESVAAAAAIKAALLDESSATHSSEKFDVGHNILHDICRYLPPLDVIELLLTSLRHRRGTTSGRDDAGRTPLHVAVAFGAAPDVIDALTRADPVPASMGDRDRRSPLHIAVRYLAYGPHPDDKPLEETNELPSLSLQQHDGHEGLSEEEMFKRSFETILILKDVMVTYPGKIDFKDEDKDGFAPVDYALDGGIIDKYLLHCLLKRKHKRRTSVHSLVSEDTQLTGNVVRETLPEPRRQDSDLSSDAQDTSVIRHLEEEEIQARRKRIEKLGTKRPKKQISDMLFDMFGIDQLQGCGPSEDQSVHAGQSLKSGGSINLPPAIVPRTTCHHSSKSSKSGSQGRVNSRLNDCKSMTDSAIYNHHLEAYLNGFVDDNEGLECLGDDDDDFDIFHDPEEENERECVELDDSTRLDSSEPPLFEINIAFDEIDDNVSQCSYGFRSVVSEVTAPVTYR